MNRNFWKRLLLISFASLGAVVGPDGLNNAKGPSEPDRPDGPELNNEPIPSLAESILADYAELTSPKAVSFVLDLQLMKPMEIAKKTVFAEDCAVTDADRRWAVQAIQALPANGTGSFFEAWISAAKTRKELAETLYTTLMNGVPGLPEIRYNQEFRINCGTSLLNNCYLFFAGGNAVENSGNSNLVVKNSTIRGTTTKESRPLSGPPSGLTVSGSIRTTLALNQSQAYYINSRVISKDWAVFSTDGAEPVEQAGQKELSIYVYGSEGIAEDGGYGTYSDLFCNVYFYGTRLRAPEIGAISGTFGTLTFGSIADGEVDAALAAHLTPEDCALQKDKQRGSHLIGGRNAVMIHCVSLPPYWGRPGYSQTELPYHEGSLVVRHSILETNRLLDRNIQYPDQLSTYLRHSAGSVILVKSCNAKILLDDTQTIPDSNATGALLHTVINSDLPFMVRVPDGVTYPGSHVEIRNSNLTGDILHEDYQRDLYLYIEHSHLTGKLFTGTVDSWNAFCRETSCECYIIDPEGYRTIHGSHMTLGPEANWTVTGNSNLNDLEILQGATIKPPEGKKLVVTVNGCVTHLVPGKYQGDIRLTIS